MEKITHKAMKLEEENSSLHIQVDELTQKKKELIAKNQTSEGLIKQKDEQIKLKEEQSQKQLEEIATLKK